MNNYLPFPSRGIVIGILLCMFPACDRVSNSSQSHVDYSNIKSQLTSLMADSMEETGSEQDHILVPSSIVKRISLENHSKEVFLAKSAIKGDALDASVESFLVVRLQDGRLRHFMSGNSAILDDSKFVRSAYIKVVEE